VHVQPFDCRRRRRARDESAKQAVVELVNGLISRVHPTHGWPAWQARQSNPSLFGFVNFEFFVVKRFESREKRKNLRLLPHE
jgi:hypothetical protein